METNDPAVTAPESAGYQVDDLIIDLGQRRVTRGGNDIPLPHLSFQLLVTLARSAPDVVTFDQLTARVWPDLVISPETISQRVKLVRDALGDDPQAPRYIAGVRGSGYRMVATVRPLKDRRRSVPGQELPYWIKPQDADPGAAASAAVGNTAHASPPAASVASVSASKPHPLAWIGALLVIAVLLAAPWTINRYLRAPKRADGLERGPGVVVVQPPRTIAVLPLLDMSPDGSSAYLGDGLAQELSARLARLPGVRVAARTSAFAFRNRSTDVRTIAQTLGVRHILEGSVHREGERLRVTAQLIDGISGYDVWSQTYNRTWQDLMAIEDELARSIISSLRVVLSSDLALRTAQPPTTQPRAFDLYLAGLAQLQGAGGAAALDEAGDSFRRALVEDPKFALAYAGLCERYALGYDKKRDAALIPQAESACGDALKLDPSLREVSAALGQLYFVSGRYEQAAAIYRDAIGSDPDNADGYVGLGEALDAQHRSTDAERAFRKAVEVEPTYWVAQNALGNFLFRHGRTSSAIATYRRVTSLIPASALAFNNLGAALEFSGDFQGAATAFDRSLSLEPSSSAYSNSGTVYYFLGRYADAARMFIRATELATQDHRMWGNLADALWQTEGSRAEAQRNYRRAIELAQKSLAVNARDAITWSQLGHYSARTRDGSDVSRYVRQALQLSPDDPNVRYYVALTALELGDRAAALESLSRAVELGYPLQLVRAAPDFASLRRDARFRQLLAQADVPPAG
ncbi:MAG TPA: tetratricopeptide repeat protein [Steroidobacteraceae bacterium]|jgi:TolB-like protein/DNA-binding winged helix-turn-helix (wHTH) protein/Tfp pilus assembly protein PilF|nr:tetratricopeptide repeat protein [Steroidobacteraceae bacterium]